MNLILVFKKKKEEKGFLQRETGGFEGQYHSRKPATMETWAGSNHGQTLVRLLKIRGASFKISSRERDSEFYIRKKRAAIFKIIICFIDTSGIPPLPDMNLIQTNEVRFDYLK